MSPFKTTKFKILLQAICLALIFALAASACSRSEPPRFTSFANLYTIGGAIRDYEFDHGKLPQQLSALVPQYIPLDRAGIFFVTNKYVRNPSKPSDFISLASRIDQFSSYLYLNTNGSTNILAFEKPDLWKPNVSYYGKVAVLFTDFSVNYLPVTDLQGLVPASYRSNQSNQIIQH